MKSITRLQCGKYIHNILYYSIETHFLLLNYNVQMHTITYMYIQNVNLCVTMYTSCMNTCTTHLHVHCTWSVTCIFYCKGKQ